jgi:hypothetical protein
VPYKLGTQTSSRLMHLVVANREYLPPTYLTTRRTGELLASVITTIVCGQHGSTNGRAGDGVANYTRVGRSWW